MPTKSANNAIELNFVQFDSTNNKINFSVDIVSNGAPVAASVYDANSSSNGAFSLPTGNTASRPANPQLGVLRYNTTLNLVEVYTLNGWTSVIGAVPTITNVTPSSFDGNIGTAFTIFGTGFQSDASVRFITANGSEYIAATVIYANSTVLQATTPRDFLITEGPLDVKIVQSNSTAITTSTDVIQCGASPIWNTSSGTIATIYEDASGVVANVNAYDPDSASITYSIVSGSLPSGLSLISANGAVVGNVSATSSQTTSTFSVAAIDAGGNQTTRSFSIVVAPLATGGTISTFTSGANTWRIHAFTSNASFVANKTLTADILLVGGGGAGGYGYGDQDTGKGGGGAGGVLWGQNRTINSGSYSMSIGQGGNYRPNGTNSTPPAGENGNNTTAFGVTAFGGGAGGQSDNQNWNVNNTGGSGGGAGARNTNGTSGWPSIQTTPAGWTAYGNPGGGAQGNANYGGGGGGGAGAVGNSSTGPSNDSQGGAGGIGIDMSSYFGTTYGDQGWFAGGGGGGTYTTGTIRAQSPGGRGGGGAGVSAKESTGSPNPQFYASNINGLPNTGGGGGGASEDGQDSSGNQAGGGSSSGGGGSGIILVRYLIRP